MRLVHLADCHLGYRQYQRQTRAGSNQREADVALTFQRAVDRIIELAPDAVVVAGDVFHSPRPSNRAVVHAFSQFQRLRTALPNAAIVIVAGNHDMPRTSDLGSILVLFEKIGIQIALTARRIAYPELGLSILAVPDVPGQRPPLEPETSARHNVLVLHGEAAGVIPVRGGADRPASEIPIAELHADEWGYVALGHYHVYRHVAGRAYYSGSIDYTSTNTWGELAEEQERSVPGKGFIEHDLATGAHTFHPVTPARVLADLEPVDAQSLSAEDLNNAIRARVEGCAGGIDGKVLRLIVRNVPRELGRAVDHKLIRDYKRRALHFQLELRKAVEIRRAASAAARRQSLEEMVRARFGELGDLAISYLDKAEAQESAAALLAERGEDVDRSAA